MIGACQRTTRGNPRDCDCDCAREGKGRDETRRGRVAAIDARRDGSDGDARGLVLGGSGRNSDEERISAGERARRRGRRRRRRRGPAVVETAWITVEERRFRRGRAAHVDGRYARVTKAVDESMASSAMEVNDAGRRIGAVDEARRRSSGSAIRSRWRWITRSPSCIST